MSKGSLLCSLLLLLQVICVAQLSVVSSWQLPGGGKFPRRDPIRRAALLMSSGHGRRGELESHSADSIFDDEGLDALDEYASDVPAEEEDGWLPGDGDGGDDSGGARDSSSGGSGGDVECPECGKFFRNNKSMFGHLRSHPNKGYRGATPPSNKLKMLAETAAASASSSSPDNHNDEPPALLSQRDRQVTLSDIVCSYVMLALKYRDDSQPSEPSQQQVMQVPLPAPAPAPLLGETKVDAAEQETPGTAMDNAMHCDEHSGSIARIPSKRRNMFRKIREGHMKKVKFVSAAKEKAQYFCKHCNAEFSTHQALGGHMAGHHREKKVLALNDSSSRVQQGMAAQSLNGKLKVKGSGDDDDAWRDGGLSLQRGMLSEKLSMSKHVERRSDGLTPAVPAPAQTQADDRGGRRPLNIDLNAAAPEQE